MEGTKVKDGQGHTPGKVKVTETDSDLTEEIVRREVVGEDLEQVGDPVQDLTREVDSADVVDAAVAVDDGRHETGQPENETTDVLKTEDKTILITTSDLLLGTLSGRYLLCRTPSKTSGPRLSSSPLFLLSRIKSKHSYCFEVIGSVKFLSTCDVMDTVCTHQIPALRFGTSVVMIKQRSQERR